MRIGRGIYFHLYAVVEFLKMCVCVLNSGNAHTLDNLCTSASTIDLGACIWIGFVRNIVFSCCLLVGIIDFGDRRLTKNVRERELRTCLSIGIIWTVCFGDGLLIGIF